MTEVEKLDLRSHDISADKREELLHLFPETRTEDGKIDFDRLRLALSETIDVGKERYGLNWPGKADCFKAIQSPSLGTLLPVREESINFDTTENLIIEGDNLEVLKLLQKSYLGKIKMIYIDPPYNTGNDFIYPDDYSESLQTYLEYTGQIDAEGRKFSTNTDAAGRFHSKWLNMMYPRLYLARNLLSEDGVFVCSIDNNEVANLAKLCGEVFGEENFISQITVQSNPRGRQSDTFLATVHDYLLLYARNIEECILGGSALSESQRAEFNLNDEEGKPYRLLGLRQRGSASRREDRPDMYFPIYVNPQTLKISLNQSEDFTERVVPKKSTGEDGRWMWGRDKVHRDGGLVEARLISRRGEYDIFVRDYLERNGQERVRKFKTIWDSKELNTQNGTQEVKALIGSDAMPFPKPVALLKDILSMGAQEDSLVLDFFAGSGTLGHAVYEANTEDHGKRRFVLVQLPEPTNRDDYSTISDIAKERLRKATAALGEKTKGQLPVGDTEQDLGFRVFKLAESNFTTWDSQMPHDSTALAEQLELHVDHTRDGRSPDDILYEILLKSGYPLTTTVESVEIEGNTVFSIAEGLLLVCLGQELTLELVRAIGERQPERVICLDQGFAANDQLKANAAQLFKNKGIVFRTV